MITATVKWWSDSKGYGFVTLPDGRDCFAHYSAIYTEGFKTLAEGEIVTIRLVDGPKGPQCGEIYRKDTPELRKAIEKYQTEEERHGS